MKEKITLIVFTLLAMCTMNVKAQESSWSAGLDIYNTYVWRGTKYGNGPSFQPGVKFNSGGFTLGAWGAYSASNSRHVIEEGTEVDAYREADLYASYALNFGEKSTLTFAVTDYFFPGGSSMYFDSDSHYVEPMLTLGLGNFGISAAYMTNVEDTYVEAGYTAGAVTLFAGAGDGQYTVDQEFNFCNVGIKTIKEIKVSETFVLPVSGSVVLNPSTEQFHIVVGFSL